MTASVTFVNFIALLLEMSSAFARATDVFLMWAIFVPMEVATSETWGRGGLLCFELTDLLYCDGGSLQCCRRSCGGFCTAFSCTFSLAKT